MSLKIVDFQAATFSAKPAVKVYSDAAQTLTTAMSALVTFNQDEYDRWGMHDTSSNSERLTAKVPGIYLLQANIAFASNSTGRRLIDIRHNSSAGGLLRIPARSEVEVNANGVTFMNIMAISDVAEAGDYFVVLAFQTSGGDLDIPAASQGLQYSQTFSAAWHSLGVV